MTTMTYEDICEKLDDLSLKLFELLDRLMEERIKLNDTMKFAFVDMAKARYSLGNYRVSSLQLDMKEMSAMKRIIANENTVDGYSFNSFTTVDTANIDEKNISKESNIRKRNPQINSSNKTENMDINRTTSVCDTSTEMEIMETKNNFHKMHDPLKWFGILTPQSLRNCQKHFQQSIDNIATIASIQNEIKALFNYIKYLKAEKKNCLNKKSSES